MQFASKKDFDAYLAKQKKDQGKKADSSDKKTPKAAAKKAKK